ncbi:MAG: hypothetical protein E6J59_17335 [Deltaproteobacteria bacterium]|nr:MAG: hypothetical protein E6J59_17335 [Deltaproteobacteria bacterium]
MRGTRLQVARVGTTLLVAGLLVAAGPPAAEPPAAEPPVAELRVEVPPGLDDGARSLNLRPEDAPPPGSCRLWYPHRKRADQPPPGPCARLTRDIPAGAWILHRALDGKRLLRIH